MNWSSDWDKPAKKIEQQFANAVFNEKNDVFGPIPSLSKNNQVILGDGSIMKIIELPWNNNRRIGVETIGDLGLEYDDDGWEVYHIPTLCRFSKAVPGYYPATMEFVDGQECYDYDRDQLLNWMKKVQEGNPTAWTMLRLLTPENYADKGAKAKEIIQAWCLSVKVE